MPRSLAELIEGLETLTTHRDGRLLLSETITKLRHLEQRNDLLKGLEGGGVDNWEWYSESLKDYFRKYYPEDYADDTD